MKKIELLAPAGDLEKLKWAINYGADAVYIGGKNYSLRANANNFTLGDIKKGVVFAHRYNKKVYLALNMIFHNEDLSKIKEYVTKVCKLNIDGIIISDPFLIDIIKNINSNIEIHLSTQQSTLNKETVLFWKKTGISRIVLAREVNKADIDNIIKNTNMDIEIFIHGAMCSNFSGRCVLSNYLTNRDSNRGGCSQVCRFNFDLYDSNNHLLSKSKDFSLASKDLSLAKYIKTLIKLNVKSLKIEGRMRSIYYIATVVNIYRNIIDRCYSNTLSDNYIEHTLKILYRCSNREVIPQFFNKKISYNEQYYLGRQEESNQDFLAVVKSYDAKLKEAMVEQRNYFKIGDEVVIFGPNFEEYTMKIKYIIDSKNNKVNAANHPQEIVKINCDIRVRKNYIIRVKI
ncbi:MAG TPA: U32 family peptidase [Bacilli bacterium]|nr:U32 family peptidase [Bacilli bacterium]